jgi:preprotein translocase subunit SecF
MEEEKIKINRLSKLAHFHDRNYKLLLLIPLLLLVFSFVYMPLFYSNNGDIMKKDISLKGGTSITINGEINVEEIEAVLSDDLEDMNTRKVYDLITREQKAIIIETKTEGCNELEIKQIKTLIEEYLGYELVDGDNASFECTGSTLSENFYRQLLIAILIAFLFMAIVVFIIFRIPLPSAAVILSALADILMTLVVVNLLGIKVSSAGIIAFLMLIGYSVDTDILLTTRVLKRDEGSLNERLFGAFKTGTTMTLTSLFAVLFAFFVVRSFSATLSQIFLILSIGLAFDLLNTWITNVSILKWYVKKKK